MPKNNKKRQMTFLDFLHSLWMIETKQDGKRTYPRKLRLLMKSDKLKNLKDDYDEEE